MRWFDEWPGSDDVMLGGISAMEIIQNVQVKAHNID
jgi:hypothetical protein